MTKNEKELRNDREIWTNYIRAQQKLADRNNRPLRLLPIKKGVLTNDSLNVELDLSEEINRIQSLVKEALPNAIFPSEENYFLLEQIPQNASDILEKLSVSLSRWHTKIEQNPVFSATVRERKAWLKPFLESLATAGCHLQQASDGDWLFSQRDLKKVDNILQDFDLARRDKIGAVYVIGGGSRASEKAEFIKNSFEKMGVNIERFSIDPHLRVVRIRNGYLSDKALHGSSLANMLRLQNWVVRYTVKIDEINDPKKNFPYRNLFPSSGELWEYKFIVPANDLEVLDFTRILFEQYFGKDGFLAEIFESEYGYSQMHPTLNEVSFTDLPDNTWEMLFTSLDTQVFSINPIRKLVSFNFEHFGKNDFWQKYECLQKFEEIGWLDYGNLHRFKVQVFPSSFEAISQRLKLDFPGLVTDIASDSTSLKLRLFYDINAQDQRLDFWNALESLQSQGFEVTFPDRFNTRFEFELDEATLALEENIRWRKLRGVEFSHLGEPLGTIGKVDFPRLQLRILPEKVAGLREHLEKNNSFLHQISPNFRGDLEKLKRLEMVVRQVFGNYKGLPNPNATRFLFDSSKAQAPSVVRDFFRKNGPEWRRVSDRLHLPLNDSQFLAVLKTLHAPELAIVQGPPGTGKSTAIAEIIRQHLLDERATRILLTSETHLAVDNAMEKLLAIPDGTVRPVRFGNEEQLETEGSRYALFRLEEWMAAENTEPPQDDNVAHHWLQRIASRVEKTDKSPESEMLQKWTTALRTPDKGLRYTFGRAYLDHTNVIGATGSSLGTLNIKGNPTSFLRQYEAVFKSEKVSSKKNEGADAVVQFDLVVMDEASKATPPELALPMLFSKKAVIVGDHRQLPPMLDEEDFVETLEWLGESALAEVFKETDTLKSHFEKLFCNPNLPETLRASFREQYRMHPAINAVIAQFYEDDEGLSCALQTPDDPDLNNPQSRWHGLFDEEFINPDTHVIWLDVCTPEIADGTSRYNPGEVEACDWAIQKLKNAKGFDEFQNFWSTDEDKEIGIISFYKSQVRALNLMINQKHQDLLTRVRPVDRFQGMERNILIVSLVRSDLLASSISQKPDFIRYPKGGYPKQNSIGFAEFPNRLNVALSRAKRLLVIVGNASHFSSKKVMYRHVLDIIKQNPQGELINFQNLREKHDSH